MLQIHAPPSPYSLNSLPEKPAKGKEILGQTDQCVCKSDSVSSLDFPGRPHAATGGLAYKG